jgi:hypothetical protein
LKARVARGRKHEGKVDSVKKARLENSKGAEQ